MNHSLKNNIHSGILRCTMLISFVFCIMLAYQLPGQQQAAKSHEHKRSSDKTTVPKLQSGVVVSIPLSFSLEEAASGNIKNYTFSGTTVTIRLQNGSEIKAEATKTQMEAALQGKTNAKVQKVNNKGWKVIVLDEPTPPIIKKTAEIKIEMVSIPGKNYSIGKYEVTQGQWKAVMESNPSYFPKGDNYPVELVSWNDCQTFIQKLNQQTGGSYRLPTEVEWEYACRGGTAGDRYGNIDDVAWHVGNSGNSTHQVGQKQPNAYGLYDTLGNVWEWCQDFFQEGYPGRVIRGGCYSLDERSVQAADNNFNGPDIRFGDMGFRLASDDLNADNKAQLAEQAKLAEIAKNDQEGGVRIAAADKRNDKSLAQGDYTEVKFYAKDKETGEPGEYLGFAILDNGKLSVNITDKSLEKIVWSKAMVRGGIVKEKVQPDGQTVIVGGIMTYAPGTPEHLIAIKNMAPKLGYYAEIGEKDNAMIFLEV